MKFSLTQEVNDYERAFYEYSMIRIRLFIFSGNEVAEGGIRNEIWSSAARRCLICWSKFVD